MNQREMNEIYRLIKEVKKETDRMAEGVRKLLKQDGVYAFRGGGDISLQPITEADLSRIVTDYMDDGFIIITSDRSCEAEQGLPSGEPCPEDLAAEQDRINKENFPILQKTVRDAGFGYVPVLGGYKEQLPTEPGEPKQYVDTDDPEDSLLIHSRKKPEELKQLGIDLAKQFNQDSFFYKPPGSEDKNAYWIKQDGSIDMTFKDFSYNDISQIYYTQLAKKPHRRFTALPENFQFYVRKHPVSVSEARRRYGETFFNIKKSED